MRNTFIASLLFALFASTAVAVTAAPMAEMAAKPATENSTMQMPASDMININGADAETLQKGLSGIGAAKAAAIVAYREENGAFTSIDELIEVKGIGKAILEKNRDKLSIE